MIKFIIHFPSDIILNPLFTSVLMDPNMKPQIASSYLIISGFALLKDIISPDHLPHKQLIFSNMSGFLLSNSAHSRCIAQYFLFKLQQSQPVLLSSLLQPGLLPLLSFINTNKDI
jgi:hypothetical protein